MKPPKSVRIGPHVWRVRRRPIDADEITYGRTLERKLTILIAPGAVASQTRETLLHELLHAIWAHTTLRLGIDEDEEERVVGSLTPWLLAALRDNPELVTCLLAE